MVEGSAVAVPVSIVAFQIMTIGTNVCIGGGFLGIGEAMSAVSKR